MRSLVGPQLLLHGETPAAALVGTDPGLGAGRHVLLGDMLAEKVALGEHGVTLRARVLLGVVVAVLMALAVRGGPEAFAAALPRTNEALLVGALVHAHVRSEMAVAEVGLPARLTHVGTLTRVRQHVLGQTRRLEVGLLASRVGAWEPALLSAPGSAVDGHPLRRPPSVR